jgi:DNA repair photolyase
MGLNTAAGNMYPFVSHTYNLIKGKCPHGCIYCYMARFPQREMRFDKKELKTDLGAGNFIFIGSSCDMWANEVNDAWIYQTIMKSILHDDNRYLFQSKNPHRYLKFLDILQGDYTLGVTLESDRDHIEGPPTIDDRYNGITKVKSKGFPVAVTMEPIMQFDVNRYAEMMDDLQQDWIAIGADSQSHDLPEPVSEQVAELIEVLNTRGHTLKIKDNLQRICEWSPKPT